MRTGQPTLRDVARLAGVSTSTTSRALGNYGRTKASTRERVLKAAAELGYRPNSLARSMITGRSDTIAVVCADIGSPFFSEAIRAITDYATEHDLSTLIVSTDESLEAERAAVELLIEKQVDGIIVAPADVREVEHLRMVQQDGTPVVLLDRSSSRLDADSVTVDDVAAMRSAVEHLIGLGHTRIGIVTELRTPRESDWTRSLDEMGGAVDRGSLNPSARRLLGYLRAHRAAGIPVDPQLVARTGDNTVESSQAATERLLRLPAAPTAIVSVDNTTSVGAYAAIRAHDIRVPDDVAFVAFDNLDWTTLVTPPLTAIEQPVRELGTKAAELLVARLHVDQQPPGTEYLFETRFLERESTRPR